jgi:hypothetical protein
MSLGYGEVVRKTKPDDILKSTRCARMLEGRPTEPDLMLQGWNRVPIRLLPPGRGPGLLEQS